MDARRHASSRKLTDDARRGAPWPHQPAWSVSFFALACVEFVATLCDTARAHLQYHSITPQVLLVLIYSRRTRAAHTPHEFTKAYTICSICALVLQSSHESRWW